MSTRRLVAATLAVVALGACAQAPNAQAPNAQAPSAEPNPARESAASPTEALTPEERSRDVPKTAGTADPAANPGERSARPVAQRSADRRFWVRDRRFYFSDWYAGKHRKMINFGCTRAPYYDPDPRCRRNRGFHHGLDMAMRCGTRLFAGMHGRVVRPNSPGALGSAYGPWAFRVRNQRVDKDFVIGHVRKVYVRPGDHVRPGQLIARASNAGAPDGCHLHFEARPKKGGYSSAVRPHPYLDLRRRR